MTTVIASSSVVIALTSLFVSFQGERRAERVALVETQLTLRGRFRLLLREREGFARLDVKRSARRRTWRVAPGGR